MSRAAVFVHPAYTIHREVSFRHSGVIRVWCAPMVVGFASGREFIRMLAFRSKGDARVGVGLGLC